MEKTVIDALRKVIGKEAELKEREEVRSKESLFMNTTRQRIFEYLCRFPCSHFSKLARSLKLSTPTARWHLDKLERSGFITSEKVGNKIVYYPPGFIDPGHVKVIYFLQKEKTRMILALLFEKGGLAQKEIREALGINNQTLIWYTSRLEEYDLLSTLEDGRYKRYYPTNRLIEMSDKNQDRIKAFRQDILEKLALDGVSPKVLRSTGRELHVEVRSGAGRRVMTLHTNPFATILSQ